MKNLKYLLLSMFVVFGILSSLAQKNGYVKEYNIASFSSVSANTVADIIYTQCDNAIVKAVGTQEMLNHLQITQNQGVLTIENGMNFNKKSDQPFTIYLSSPTIDSIKTKGMGNWKLQGKIKTNYFMIQSDGIGSFQALKLESEKICIKYSGVGFLKLGGTTDFVEINSEGFGNIDCENLISKTAIVKSTEIGKVKCFASESVALFNEGIGEITYLGNPTFKNFKNSGMGKINEGL